MNICGFETVDSLPLLYHPELDLLVAADLHLGLEQSATSQGNYVPGFQLDRLKQDMEDARDETGADRVLLNGDLKNEFQTRYAERSEIEEFLEFLQGLFEDVIVVKGNHDTIVEETVEKTGLRLLDSYMEDDVLFVHGDTEVDEEFETVVIGHEHPALVLTDEIGVSEKVPCFLYGETSKGENIVVLPAFSPIKKGTEINRTPQHELLSPVLRNRVDKDRLKAVGVSREAGVFKFPEIGKI